MGTPDGCGPNASAGSSAQKRAPTEHNGQDHLLDLVLDEQTQRLRATERHKSGKNDAKRTGFYAKPAC